LNRSFLELATSHSALRYAIVGVGNTAVGLTAIFAIKYFLGASDAVANLGGYVIGFIFSYTFNSSFTFRYSGPLVAGIVKFALVTIIAYLCNLATVLAAVRLGLNPYLAQVLGVPAYAIVCYLGGRFFAFEEKAPIERDASV
jgi:putative flippase GtrA